MQLSLRIKVRQWIFQNLTSRIADGIAAAVAQKLPHTLVIWRAWPTQLGHLKSYLILHLRVC